MEENKIAEQPVELQPKEQTSPSDSESFETIDYVKELFLHSIEQKKADKKKIRLMRFCALCMAIITLTLVAAVILARPYIETVVNDFDAITQKILAIDVKSLTDNAQQLMTDANTAIKSAGDTLDALDMEALNTTIKDLGDKIDAMDMEQLNDAITALNNVASKLDKIKWPFSK